MDSQKILTVLIILLFLNIAALLFSDKVNPKESYERKAGKMFVIVAGAFNEEMLNALENTYKGKYDMLDVKKDDAITPQFWNNLANIIFNAYTNYDSFVVLCKPESISYTAAAMSYMLEHLGKTVVFTSNLLAGAYLAANFSNIPEVVVYDGKKVYRANSGMQLGKNEGTLSINRDKLLHMPKEPLKLLSINPKKKINVLKLFPGISISSIEETLRGVSGVIIEGSIGSDQKLQGLIENAIKSGVIVYVPSVPISLESALTKLYVIISNTEQNQDLITTLMSSNLRGELNAHNVS